MGARGRGKSSDPPAGPSPHHEGKRKRVRFNDEDGHRKQAIKGIGPRGNEGNEAVGNDVEDDLGVFVEEDRDEQAQEDVAEGNAVDG